MRYEFTEGTPDARTLYEVKKRRDAEPELNCGFVTDENADAEESLRIPEINSGFVKADKCGSRKMIRLKYTPVGVKTDYEGDGLIPLLFKADVSEPGNYAVKVVLYAEEETDGMLFLGRRRLVMKRHFSKGNFFAGEYLANVLPVIPRGHSEYFEDKTVDVALVGRGLVLKSVEIRKADVPVIYIAGDSTLTDQSAVYPYDPALSYSGWGQMLSYFVGNAFAISNQAHSGLTTESMRSEGHYDVIFNNIKPGDYCLFQFGHNDQKLESLKAFEGYTANLKRYIDEIKGKGATPVIVSPLARNTWKGDGTYNDLLCEYAAACEKIAKENAVPYVDLHAKSMDFVTSNGREAARAYYFPSDYTHSNDYGAYLFAGFVYEGLAKCGIVEPDTFEEWKAPEEVPVIKLPEETLATEEGAGENAENTGDAGKAASGSIPAEDLFAGLERPDDLLTRAEAFEMVIKTVKFFPTNVYNDLFEDVLGHETYAGSIECALQNGIIPKGG
ncbi:MAG: rhamnogalacturonan acetylesterase [Lachnospiraceae bacterium]|nr:rhamnogalacturonan acetylesterase [Lachnospiraceae bacterium]